MTKPRLSRAAVQALHAKAMRRRTRAASHIARQIALIGQLRAQAPRCGESVGGMMERIARMAEDSVAAGLRILQDNEPSSRCRP